MPPKKTSYKEFESRILSIKDYREVVDEARKEYEVISSGLPPDFIHRDIPFNLERKYFDELVNSENFIEAEKLLKRMLISYPEVAYQNFIESYEYRLELVKRTKELFDSEKVKLKQELNQHNITTISIVVGVITIFGVASQTLIAKTFQEGIQTFFAIVLAVVFLVAIAFLTNSFFYRNQK